MSESKQPTSSKKDKDENLQTSERDADVKSARTLATIAIIAGPVSLFVGGLFLSIVSLICAILAYVKVKNADSERQPKQSAIGSIGQTAIVGIGVCAFAIVLNIIGVVAALPTLIDTMQSGNYSSLLNSTDAGNQSVSPSNGESVWG